MISTNQTLKKVKTIKNADKNILSIAHNFWPTCIISVHKSQADQVITYNNICFTK